MNKKNKFDYFHGELAEDAIFCGDWEIPYVESSGIIPEKVITFSKCIKSKDYDSWVVFYEGDNAIERVWRNPQKYLPILKRFRGAVGLDYSLCGDYPIVLQAYNTYRSRILTHWFKRNGINVIPNVRWSTEHTYDFSFSGLKYNDIIFVGSHGCTKRVGDRTAFEQGLREMVKRIKPRVICVYGKTSLPIFDELRKEGIQIVGFESEYSKTHEEL